MGHTASPFFCMKLFLFCLHGTQDGRDGDGFVADEVKGFNLGGFGFTLRDVACAYHRIEDDKLALL